MTVYGTFSRTIYTTSGSTSEAYTMYGRPGSTITDEFNRLANGGEYPDKSAYLGYQGAVNKWTGTVTGTGVIKALNKTYGISDNFAFLDLNGIVNYILENFKEGGEGDPGSAELQPVNYLEAVTALRLIAS